MSTETTQNFAELIGTSALRGALAGLRGVTSPDVPYPSPKAEPAELAYAATVGFIGEQAEHASLKAAKDAAKLQIEDAIRSAIPGSDRARDLADLKDRLDSAKSPGEISALLAAVANASAQTAAPETPAAQVEKLRAQINELEKDIATKMREAHDRGDMSDAEYKKWQELNQSIEAMPEGPEKDKAITARAKMEEKALHNAAESADGKGDGAQAQSYRESEKKAKTVGTLSEQLANTQAKYTQTTEQKFAAYNPSSSGQATTTHPVHGVKLAGVTQTPDDANHNTLPKNPNSNSRSVLG